MKHQTFLIWAFSLLSLGFFAQGGAAKFGYVDTDYILSQIPEYKAAQNELDKTSQNWQKEIEGKYAEVEKLNKAYQADAILLTEEMKKKAGSRDQRPRKGSQRPSKTTFWSRW